MTFVESEHFGGVISLRENDDGSIRETDLQVRMALDDLSRSHYVRRAEWLKLICPERYFLQECSLGMVANPAFLVACLHSGSSLGDSLFLQICEQLAIQNRWDGPKRNANSASGGVKKISTRIPNRPPTNEDKKQ